MSKIKWIKEYNGHQATVDGYRVDRVKHNAGYRYYVLYVTNIDYAAPHHQMSSKLYSLSSARQLIKRLKSTGENFSYEQLAEFRKYSEYDNVVSIAAYRAKRGA